MQTHRFSAALAAIVCASIVACAPPPRKVIVVTRPAMTVKAPGEMMAELRTRHSASINACTKGVLERDANAAGTYKLHFRVDTKGNVFPTGVDGPNEGLRACLFRAANTWTFKARLDANGKPVVSLFTLPLKLYLATKARSQPAAGTMAAISSRYLPQVHACHNAAAKRDASVHGELVIVFRLRQDGSTGDVKVSGAGEHARLLTCVANSVRAWRLPAPVLVTGDTSYPVRLRVKLAKPKVVTSPR